MVMVMVIPITRDDAVIAVMMMMMVVVVKILRELLPALRLLRG